MPRLSDDQASPVEFMLAVRPHRILLVLLAALLVAAAVLLRPTSPEQAASPSLVSSDPSRDAAPKADSAADRIWRRMLARYASLTTYRDRGRMQWRRWE
ncbi:MAG TPA: hypothetical protein VIY86_08445, partial [Pirellulaceae bacterium]